ncbi:hypothetical protein ACLOJK_001939, partial [Asimina triloba]
VQRQAQPLTFSDSSSASIGPYRGKHLRTPARISVLSPSSAAHDLYLLRLSK